MAISDFTKNIDKNNGKSAGKMKTFSMPEDDDKSFIVNLRATNITRNGFKSLVALGKAKNIQSCIKAVLGYYVANGLTDAEKKSFKQSLKQLDSMDEKFHK